MDIWLDTIEDTDVETALELGILTGITTNPTLFGKKKKDEQKILADLLHIQEGPVAVQLLSDTVEDMVQEGQNLYDFSNRLIIKVPVTKEGLKAIYLLSRQGIPTMATAIACSSQVLMSVMAGAEYVAPYINRIEQSGKDPWKVLESIQTILANYKFNTKVLGASLKTVEQIMKCAEIGIYGVTISHELFEKLIETQLLTSQWVAKFKEDVCMKI